MARTKKGLAKISQETLDRLAAGGVSPVEVMVSSMRTLMSRAQICHELAEIATSDNERDRYMREAAECADKACEIAKDVAPYFHPRLASIEHKGDEDNPIGVELSSVDELRKLVRGGGTPPSPKPKSE